MELKDMTGAKSVQPETSQIAYRYRTHPMAQHLRQLGLHNAKPLLVQFTDAFQSRLNAGEIMPG